jgi:hypothetical protein
MESSMLAMTHKNNETAAESTADEEHFCTLHTVNLQLTSQPVASN